MFGVHDDAFAQATSYLDSSVLSEVSNSDSTPTISRKYGKLILQAALMGWVYVMISRNTVVFKELY